MGLCNLACSFFAAVSVPNWLCASLWSEGPGVLGGGGTAGPEGTVPVGLSLSSFFLPALFTVHCMALGMAVLICGH